MWHEWSTLKKLIWLHILQGASAIIKTVTGTSPLTLDNAVNKAIKSLIQYGKCATVNWEIYCNNGKLIATDDELPPGYQRQIGFKFAASTYYKIPGFHLRGSDTVRLSFSVDKACNVFGCYTDTSATDNYSLYASTASGAKYLRYDGDTYNSSIPSSRFGERFDAVIAPTGTTGMPTDSVITPATFESVADLHIGTTSQSASSSKLDGCIWGDFIVDNRLTLIPVKRLSDDVLGYYDPDTDTFYEPIGSAPTSLGVDTSHLNILSVEGTPEVLTIGTQTATVKDLFEVGGVADEQDIISGVVTRKVEVSVSGGVITLSALATPVTEHVTPQPLSTVEGDNTLSWTAEVSGTVKEVEYAYVAPSFEWKTASGAVVNVSDAIAGEVGALTVSINPVQGGSGDPSPDNVRPISGWDKVSVFVTGKNLWNPDISTDGTAIDKLEYIGQYSGYAVYGFPVPANTQFRVHASTLASGSAAIFIQSKRASADYGTAVSITNLAWAHDRVLTSDESGYMYLLSNTSISATLTAVSEASVQVEVGNQTATDFAAFVGGSTPVSLGGTYYGGTLDVLTGVLTVDRVAAVFDGSDDETWSHFSIASGELFRTSITERKTGIISTQTNQCKCICSAYKEATNQGSGRVNGTFSGDSKNVDFVNDSYTTVDAWRTYLRSNNVTFVYELATPQTVQLTPAQVSTLLGTNVIWASGNGEVSVTYRAEVGE